MPIKMTNSPGASEDQIIEEMARDGFVTAIKDYYSGTTEPHTHDYDVCLYILDGEFRVTDTDASVVHRFRPGDKVLVDRGTTHAEDHGPLRMIVGRRH